MKKLCSHVLQILIFMSLIMLCTTPVIAELTEEEYQEGLDHIERHMKDHDSHRDRGARMPDDQNPFISGPPELQECLKRGLGEETFNAIKGGRHRPTREDEAKIGSCMNKGMNNTIDAGELPVVPGYEGLLHTYEDSWHLRDDRGMTFGSNYRETGREPDKFIIANPLDLSEIVALSAFRSCMGHDHSGWNIDGVEEKNRSMKNYVIQRDDLEHAKVFAPFDGKITDIEDDGPRGEQIWVTPDVNPRWKFIFFHIELLPGFELGSDVKAGQQIGVSHVGEAKNFDIGLRKFEAFKGPNVHVFLFDHMSDPVLAQYRARGATPENLFVSKTERDANPCVFIQGTSDDEIVILK